MFECAAITTFIWREEQDLLKVLCMQGKEKNNKLLHQKEEERKTIK